MLLLRSYLAILHVRLVDQYRQKSPLQGTQLRKQKTVNTFIGVNDEIIFSLSKGFNWAYSNAILVFVIDTCGGNYVSHDYQSFYTAMTFELLLKINITIALYHGFDKFRGNILWVTSWIRFNLENTLDRCLDIS